MRRLSLVVLGLVALAVVAPITATATPTPTGTATPENTTTTPSTSPGATSTATPDPISTVEVVGLLETSGSWSQEQARRVYEFVRSGRLSQLGEDRVRDLLARLLERAAREDVPIDVLESAAGAVPDAEAVARDVAARLPEDQATQVALRLREAGGWASGLLDSVIDGATASTPTPTPALASDGTGNASTVIAQVGPNVQVVSWDYRKGTFFVTVDADLPTRIVVSDALGPVASEGVSKVPQRSIFVEDRQTIQMEVTQYRGAAAISLATSDGAVYLSTGISIGNPWEGGSPTVGWIGGSSVAILMFVTAGWWTLRREESVPKVADRGSKRGEDL